MGKFLARTLASTIHRVSAHFPVLLLSGPRQVGTMAVPLCSISIATAMEKVST